MQYYFKATIDNGEFDYPTIMYFRAGCVLTVAKWLSEYLQRDYAVLEIKKIKRLPHNFSKFDLRYI